MELNFYTKVEGVGAASGIHYQEGDIYLIGDNSAYLYQFQLTTKRLCKTQVLSTDAGEPVDNMRKQNKPDFETLCFYQNKLYLLGSGSTSKRNTLVIYCILRQTFYEQDLSEIYAKLIISAAIDQDNLNIEGAIFTGQEWLLFNRGNGSLARNGIFRIVGEKLTAACEIQFTPIVLPKIENVVSSFTDAVRLGRQIYFLTTAEDTVSTYEDGKVLGSFVGCMDVDSFEMKFIVQISSSHKFEGITIYKQREDGITFLLCEDKDSEEMSSNLYQLNYKY